MFLLKDIIGLNSVKVVQNDLVVSRTNIWFWKTIYERFRSKRR